MGSQCAHANQVIRSGAVSLYKSIGLDINDSKATWPGQTFTISGRRHEDSAGSPLHVLLIVLSLIVIMSSSTLKHQRNVLLYISALVIAFAFFCLQLRWQMWHNRLLLPLIILWAPIVALVIAEITAISAANAIVITLVLTALPFVVLNESHPLISNRSILTTDRINQYFINRPSIMQTYYVITNHLKRINCSDVAIEAYGDSWEYPLWVLLQQEVNPNIRIEHVNVNNKSGKIPIKKFTYCEVVSIGNGIQ
jgi:hypothetical protein